MTHEKLSTLSLDLINNCRNNKLQILCTSSTKVSVLQPNYNSGQDSTGQDNTAVVLKWFSWLCSWRTNITQVHLPQEPLICFWQDILQGPNFIWQLLPVTATTLPSTCLVRWVGYGKMTHKVGYGNRTHKPPTTSDSWKLSHKIMTLYIAWGLEFVYVYSMWRSKHAERHSLCRIKGTLLTLSCSKIKEKRKKKFRQFDTQWGTTWNALYKIHDIKNRHKHKKHNN